MMANLARVFVGKTGTIVDVSEPQVLILQHADWEKPGRILENLEDLDMPYEILNISREKHADMPDFNEVAGLVLMGGPMSALDWKDYPGLKTELKLVKAAISVNKPVLGVCLGHQIIAAALGAKIKKGAEPEIGVAPIHREGKHDFFSMWNKQLDVLNWHSDVATLPDDAQLLASSALTKNQAFRFGSALGMQFHLEVTPQLLEEWLDEPKMVKELKNAGLSKSQLRESYTAANQQLQPFAEQVFSGFAARTSSYAQMLKSQQEPQIKIS